MITLTPHKAFRGNKEELILPLRIGKHSAVEIIDDVVVYRSIHTVVLEVDMMRNLYFTAEDGQLVIVPYTWRRFWVKMLDAPLVVHTLKVHKEVPELFELIRKKHAIPYCVHILLNKPDVIQLRRLLFIKDEYLAGLTKEQLTQIRERLTCDDEFVYQAIHNYEDRYVSLLNKLNNLLREVSI